MRRALKIIAWIVVGLILLVILLVGIFIFAPTGWLQAMAGSKGSQGLGRTVAIDGPIKIDWDWTTPQVHIGKLTVANTAGQPDPDMIAIDQIDFHIRIWKLLTGQLNLPDINLVHPHILLEKNADGSKNWDFPSVSKANAVTHAALPSQRSNMPILGTLTIEGGQLTYRDDTTHFAVTLGVDTATGEGAGGVGNFKLAGSGTLQQQPFTIDAEGGSLTMLRNTDTAYPLDLKLMMGKTKVAIKGSFTDPIKMNDLDTTLDLQGDNLADLFYITTIPLPPTPPYQLGGHLTKHGDIWAFDDFKGKVGQSDLEGHMKHDTSGARGMTTAELTSNRLRMEDLAGFIGGTTTSKDAAAATGDDKNKRLLPDVPINLDRLRTSDMDISFKATQIDQPGWPLDNLNVRFDLKDGVLRLDPLSFGIADGVIAGAVVLDGSKDEPHVGLDLALRKLSLKPFFTNTKFADFSTGHFGGHVDLHGHGSSLADVLGDSNGRLTLLMSGGTMSKLIVDAAGLDLGKLTPALLGKDQSTSIRCAIGDFGVKDGVMDSRIFVLDTTASNIQGKAKINMKQETINASIEAHPKEPSITARTPITITGTFSKPSIGLDPQELAERGIAAAALSIFTPFASIIPFIEPGLGKDSDCQRYIEEAQAPPLGQPVPPAKP